MSAPKLSTPNLPKLTKESIFLGEALQATQTYINKNTAPAAGNAPNTPTFVAITRVPG